MSKTPLEEVSIDEESPEKENVRPTGTTLELPVSKNTRTEQLSSDATEPREHEFENHAVVEATDCGSEFSEKTWKEDMTLVVEGKNLFVAKNVLAFASPVFCKMLESEFKEKSQNELELPGKRYADVLEFLRCFYPGSTKRVNDKNVRQVLSLADEYQTQSLLDNCEAYLVNSIKNETPIDDLLNHLSRACVYRLGELKQTCLRFLAEKSLDELENADDDNKELLLEVSQEFIRIINMRKRLALNEARQSITVQKSIKNYAISGLQKSEVNQLQKFDYVAGTCIKLRFKKKPLKGSYLDISATAMCNGLQWEIMLLPNYNETCMEAELSCNSKDLKGSCQVCCRVVVINMFPNKQHAFRSFAHTFSTQSTNKCVKVITYKEIEDETSGFLIDEKINVEVYLLCT